MSVDRRTIFLQLNACNHFLVNLFLVHSSVSGFRHCVEMALKRRKDREKENSIVTRFHRVKTFFRSPRGRFRIWDSFSGYGLLVLNPCRILYVRTNLYLRMSTCNAKNFSRVTMLSRRLIVTRPISSAGLRCDLRE